MKLKLVTILFTALALMFSAIAPAQATGSEPVLRVIALNNVQCQFRVIGSFPSSPKSATAKLQLSFRHINDINEIDLTLSDEAATNGFDLTFSPDMHEANSLSEVASYDLSRWAPGFQGRCGTPLDESIVSGNLSYFDLADNYWESYVGSIPLTSPPTKIVSAWQNTPGSCLVNVVALIPDDVRPVAIQLVNSEEDIVSQIAFDRGVTDYGLIYATLSLANEADIDASIPSAGKNIYVTGQPCDGTYSLELQGIGGIIGAAIPISLSPAVCNAGSILDAIHSSCIDVPVGFYTRNLSSTSSIACPAGMTTAAAASKSINDCYTPIIQSIAGFKAPKAMKFGATATLAMKTNVGALASFSVSGGCMAKMADVVSKVKGKKVTTKLLKVTAGKKASSCSLTLTSPAIDKYLALSKTLTIKVSKTGK
jgi:hypothetical protein